MNIEFDHRPLATEIREAVWTYLRKRDGRQMVTTSDAIIHLRGTFPMLEASDRFLADVVAGQAIVLGLNVELDGTAKRRAVFDRWPARRGYSPPAFGAS